MGGMISIILPYWDRQAAADAALESIANCYGNIDLEVVVVDDGTPEPFRRPPLDLEIAVYRLPQKAKPLSPVTCWNEGVKVARGSTIVLSCIEVLHTSPVLGQMAAELELIGPDGYVLAAAWCPELLEWHCHSRFYSAGAPPLPPGCGRAFCAMLSKELYLRAGGFDEEYRSGAGYEDIDWVYRLLQAGANFKIRDDLVVVHPKTGASIRWGGEQFARNAALLAEKWPC